MVENGCMKPCSSPYNNPFNWFPQPVSYVDSRWSYHLGESTCPMQDPLVEDRLLRFRVQGLGLLQPFLFLEENAAEVRSTTTTRRAPAPSLSLTTKGVQARGTEP